MKVSFLNHSSLRIQTSSGLDIICDPWYASKVFNSSWRLLSTEPPQLADLSHFSLVFLSHEHPDHLNFPTLRKYFANHTAITRDDFREDVSHALCRIGIRHFRLRPNIIHHLPSGDQIAIFTFHGDSSLFVRDGITGKSLFNYNDCEFPHSYIESIRPYLPNKITLIAGQFGLAGYYANPNEREAFQAAKEQKILRLLSTASIFKAELVLPFASYAAFCKVHNFYINQFQPSMQELFSSLSVGHAKVWIPLPNFRLDLSADNSQDYLNIHSGASYWSALQTSASCDLDIDDSVTISDVLKSFEELSSTALTLSTDLPTNLPLFAIGVIVNGARIPISLELSNLSISLLPPSHPTDFDIPSNELAYAFANRWGADTLNITGSARVNSIDHYKLFCTTFDAILKKVY